MLTGFSQQVPVYCPENLGVRLERTSSRLAQRDSGVVPLSMDLMTERGPVPTMDLKGPFSSVHPGSDGISVSGVELN